MNQHQRETCAEARQDLDCAIDAMQDLAGDLATDERDDRPVIDEIIVGMLALKDKLLYAEQIGHFRPQIPPTRRDLGLPEFDEGDDYRGG